MTAAETLPTLAPIDDRAAFAAKFNALLDDIEWIILPAIVLPERDFSDFTL